MEKPDVDLDRRALARRRDRAEESDEDLALHRRHGDRDLRLPPPALGARRPHHLPRSAAASSSRTRCSRSTDAVLALPRGHALLRRLPAPPLRRGHARGRRREPARAGLRARGRRRRGRASRRARRSTARRRHAREGAARRRRSPRRRRRSRAGGWPTPSAPRSARATATRHPLHRRRSTSPFDGEPVDPAALHRALRVPERRHPRARADAAALLVQHPARRVPAVQRIRRGARVRRVAHRPVPRRARCATARSIRGRSRATRTSAARSPSSRRREGISMDAPWEQLPRGAARSKLLHAKRARLQGHLPLPRATSRRSATSSTSASSCGSIRRRRSVRRVTAPSSSPEALQVRDRRPQHRAR